jgi:glycosyltransferase involved in cell wall biosynthesis
MEAVPEENSEPLISIVTPAYNRAGLLPRVYQSLQTQTYRNFEWIIVDDGSADDTGSLVQSWMGAQDFPIRYFRKANGGKHTALNRGVQEARGTLFVVVDSDDWLLPNALEFFRQEWETIRHRPEFSGVCALFQYQDGAVVGSRFPEDRLVSNAIDLRMRLGVTGDKIGFTRMEIMRRFPFPEDFGRAYVPESLVWNRIAQEFDTVFVNVPVAVKEYQPEGITDRAALNSFRNPLAYFVRAAELLNGPRRIRFSVALRSCLTLAKCGLHARRNPFVASGVFFKGCTAMLIPISFLLLVRDRFRSRKA